MTFRPDRRTLLRLAALAPAFALPALAPLRAASAGLPADSVPAFHRFRVGDLPCTVVSDGTLTLPTGVLGVNADRAEVLAFLEAHYQPSDTTTAETNHLVIDSGSARVLVDAGSGTTFQPTAGKVMANLAAAGIDPASITHVVITHAHPDHLPGIIGPDGVPLLPQAEVVIGAAEHGFWTAPGLAERFPEDMRWLVTGAAGALAKVAGRTVLAADGHEVAPGIRLVATPGHTPGHMSVRVESAGRALLVTGDAATHPYISFERPDWAFGFDADPAAASATRRALLETAAAERLPVLGYHFPFPGVGHVMREAGAFRYLPAIWQAG